MTRAAARAAAEAGELPTQEPGHGAEPAEEPHGGSDSGDTGGFTEPDDDVMLEVKGAVQRWSIVRCSTAALDL